MAERDDNSDEERAEDAEAEDAEEATSDEETAVAEAEDGSETESASAEDGAEASGESDDGSAEDEEDDPFDDDELFDMVSDASDEEEDEAAEADASEDDEPAEADDAAAAEDEDPEDEPEEETDGEPGDREVEAEDELPDEESVDVEVEDDQPDRDTDGTLAGEQEESEDEAVEASDEMGESDSEPSTSVAVRGGAEADDTKAEPGETGAEDGDLRREDALLTVEDLRTYFYTKEGEVPAVDGVNFEIGKGETLGLVGESGSGKSVSALSILRLVPDPPGKIVGGSIQFQDRELTEVSKKEMQQIRGNEISMIFQEPMTSLNPVYTVGNQIVEAIELHRDVDYAEAREMAIGMLERVGIPAPDERIDEYPHQMSGGMKQRVMIAMALACNPKLLIADEPTTALDVTIQAQILELLQDLQDEFDMSVLFITHDLGVIAETCDYVAVMYGGRVVEYGDAETIFENPSHPYTIGLFSSLPQIDVEHRGAKDRLYVIPGMVPSPQDFPSGCRFRDRCDYATEECAELPPNKSLSEPDHRSLCWYAREVREGTKEKTGPFPDEVSESPEAAE